MKSFRYVAITYLLVGAYTLQAMQEIQQPKKPFSPTKEQLELVDQTEDDIKQGCILAFGDDMAKVASLLNARNAQPNAWGALKQHIPACMTKLGVRAPYSENIVLCLSSALHKLHPKDVATATLKFDKQFILKQIETHIAQKTNDKATIEYLTNALRIRKGTEYFAHCVAHTFFNQLQQPHGNIEAAPIVPKHNSIPTSTTATREKKVLHAIQNALDRETYYAFKEAVNPISDRVYFYLSYLTYEKSSYYPHDIASNFKGTTASERRRIQQCQSSRVKKTYIKDLIEKTIGIHISPDDTPESLNQDPDYWMRRAALNWFTEETNHRKGLCHSKFE